MDISINDIAALIGGNLGAVLAVGLVLYGLYRLVRWTVAAYRSAKKFVTDVVDERLPKVIHEKLHNGVKTMVTEVVTNAIRDHEERFDSRQVRTLDEHQLRLNDLEDRVEKLAGSADDGDPSSFLTTDVSPRRRLWGIAATAFHNTHGS